MIATTFFGFMFFITDISVNAAKTYYGIPSFLRAQKFRERMHKKAYIYMNCTNSSIRIGVAREPAINSLNNVRYKYYKGIRTYLFSPYWVGDNILCKNVSRYISVQRLSAKKVYIEAGTFDPGNQKFKAINYYLMNKYR